MKDRERSGPSTLPCALPPSSVLSSSTCVLMLLLCCAGQGSKHGDALALQLMDVSLRVEEVREYTVHKAVGLLLDRSLITVGMLV